MTRRQRIISAVAGWAVCAPASAADAASGPEARFAPTVKWPAREVVVSLPTKRVLGTGDVTLTENGEPVRDVRITSEAGNRKRGVVLAIDTSLTMHGEPIREAMVAARAFARRRSARASFGVVFFNAEPRVALAPTTDARAIKTALAVGPALHRGTRIFDAAASGIAALRAAQLTSGVVIVLSDGAEALRGSATTQAQLTARANAANVRIFSVGLRSRSFDSAALRAMAGATGGRYGEAARPRDLPPIFAAIGEQLSSEYLVSYRSRVATGTPTAVRLTVAGISAPAHLEYPAPRVSFAPAGPGHAAQSRGLDSTPVAIAAASVFLLLTLVGYLVLRPATRSVVSRVGDFADVGPVAPPTLPEVREPDIERPSSDRWRRFAQAIELSGIGLSPTAVVLWTLIGTVVVGWYAIAVIDRPLLAVIALAVPVFARGFVISRITRRRRAFEDQLADNLQVMASALRAGFSFSAALATMADDAAEPSRTELRRAATDEQLGIDIADCLGAVGERMDSVEIEYVGIVAQMQRESGGNTAEVLENVVATIRERLKLRRMVRVLTAQGRLGGAIVSCLPVVLAASMAVLQPGYFDPMFGSSLGVALFVASVLMLIAGWLVIRKVVDVEA